MALVAKGPDQPLSYLISKVDTSSCNSSCCEEQEQEKSERARVKTGTASVCCSVVSPLSNLGGAAGFTVLSYLEKVVFREEGAFDEPHSRVASGAPQLTRIAARAPYFEIGDMWPNESFDLRYVLHLTASCECRWFRFAFAYRPSSRSVIMDFLKSAVASIAKGPAFGYSFGDRVDIDQSIWTLHNGTKRVCDPRLMTSD